MIKKTAFTAFVFGKYDRFIPFYVYSISKNYPNSDIIIFYHSLLSNEIKSCVNTFEQVYIIENFHQEYNFFKNINLRGGGGLTLLRYLIDKKYFEQYEYLYIGDVDILILEEQQSLFEFHIQQAQQCQLPFSNKVRKLLNGELSRRLTGLHFVIVNPYFKRINPIIKEFLTNQKFREDMLEGVQRDEEFLYKLNLKAFDFDAQLLSKNLRPWHGYHLGMVRGKSFLNKNTIAKNSSLSFFEIKKQLFDFSKDKIFLKLFRKVFCIELFQTFKYFKISLPLSLILLYNFKIILKLFKGKIILIKKSFFN